jgi:hypothetical protein
MKPQTAHLLTIFIACTMLLLFPAAATSIQMVPSTVTVQKSATAEISLVLDDAPSGLAGYDLVVRFSNPGIAEISGITYPSWAALNNTTRKADGSVRISGVDLSRQVSPGATSISLANLTIRGISGGTSSISIDSVNMDADGGAIITPSLPTGQIVVSGGSVVPSGGGGGGGGDYVSLVTQSPTISPTATIVQSTPTQPSVFNENNSQPAITQTNVPTQVGVSTTTGLPEENVGIPWIWVLGGIIVLIALILGAFMAWRREQKED